MNNIFGIYLMDFSTASNFLREQINKYFSIMFRHKPHQTWKRRMCMDWRGLL